MDPTNRSAYTFQWNAQRAAHASATTTWSRSPTPAAAATTSTSATTSTRRAGDDADRDARAVSGVPVGDPLLVGRRLGAFNGVSFRLEKRYSDGFFFLGNYQLSKSRDNGSGRDRSQRHGVCDGTSNADEATRATISGIGRRSASATSCRSDRASGMLSNGGAAAHVFGGWQVQGIVRLRQRLPAHGDVDQRLPVRIVRAAARESASGRQLRHPRQSVADGVVRSRPRTRCTALGTQGTAGRNTDPRPRHGAGELLGQQAVPAQARARLEFRAEVFNLLNHNNFGNPDTNISNVTVGTITTADDGRNTQLGFRLAFESSSSKSEV